MKEILEKVFEKYYQEFKQYDTCANTLAKKVVEDRKNFEKFALENQDNFEDLESMLFQVNEKQILHLQDLAILKARLKIVTEALQDAIDIPEEIKKEVNEFPSITFMYKTNNGEFEEVDSDKIIKFKEAYKKQYEYQINEMSK